MSREHGPVGLALEWSPRGVVAYDSNTRATRSSVDLAGIAVGGREGVLALSRRGVFVRTTRVPNGSPDEVRLILTMRIGEMFPLPVIDLAWDFLLTDDVNTEGRLAVIAAVPCADLRKALDAAQAAGLKIKAAVPLAIGATLIAQELGLSEAVVVERADDGPAVDVVSGGTLRASRAAPPSASMELEVTRALGLAGLELAPIVAAGGAEINDAQRTTDRTALMALADTPFDRLNLRLELPEAVAARAATASRRQMRTAMLTLAAAAVVAVYAAMDWMDASQAAYVAQTAANSRVQRLKNTAKKATAESAAQVKMKQDLDLAFSPAQKISEVVAVATAAVPTGAWLKSISVERGKVVSLRGTAKTEASVADFLRRLDTNKDRRFRNVQVSNVSNTLVNKIPVTDFVITAFPVGNLPFLSRSGGATRR